MPTHIVRGCYGEANCARNHAASSLAISTTPQMANRSAQRILVRQEGEVTFVELLRFKLFVSKKSLKFVPIYRKIH